MFFEEIKKIADRKQGGADGSSLGEHKMTSDAKCVPLLHVYFQDGSDEWVEETKLSKFRAYHEFFTNYFNVFAVIRNNSGQTGRFVSFDHTKPSLAKVSWTSDKKLPLIDICRIWKHPYKMTIKVMDKCAKHPTKEYYVGFSSYHYQDAGKDGKTLLTYNARWARVEVEGQIAGILVYGSYGTPDVIHIMRIVVLPGFRSIRLSEMMIMYFSYFLFNRKETLAEGVSRRKRRVLVKLKNESRVHKVLEKLMKQNLARITTESPHENKRTFEILDKENVVFDVPGVVSSSTKDNTQVLGWRLDVTNDGKPGPFFKQPDQCIAIEHSPRDWNPELLKEECDKVQSRL